LSQPRTGFARSVVRGDRRKYKKLAQIGSFLLQEFLSASATSRLHRDLSSAVPERQSFARKLACPSRKFGGIQTLGLNSCASLCSRWKVGWLCTIWYVEPAENLAIEISACRCKLLAPLGDNSLLVILCPKAQGTTSFTVKDGYDPYRRYMLVGDQESARTNGFIISVR
jgi:hypothetical protein